MTGVLLIVGAIAILAAALAVLNWQAGRKRRHRHRRHQRFVPDSDIE